MFELAPEDEYLRSTALWAVFRDLMVFEHQWQGEILAAQRHQEMMTTGEALPRVWFVALDTYDNEEDIPPDQAVPLSMSHHPWHKGPLRISTGRFGRIGQVYGLWKQYLENDEEPSTDSLPIYVPSPPISVSSGPALKPLPNSFKSFGGGTNTLQVKTTRLQPRSNPRHSPLGCYRRPSVGCSPAGSTIGYVQKDFIQKKGWDNWQGDISGHCAIQELQSLRLKLIASLANILVPRAEVTKHMERYSTLTANHPGSDCRDFLVHIVEEEKQECSNETMVASPDMYHGASIDVLPIHYNESPCGLPRTNSHASLSSGSSFALSVP